MEDPKAKILTSEGYASDVTFGEAVNADQTRIRHEYASADTTYAYDIGRTLDAEADRKAQERYDREKALELAIKANCGGTNLHGTMVTAQAFFDFLTGVEKDAPHA